MSAITEDKISFICPSCAAHLQVPARLAGVTGPCPKCSATIVAPKPTPPEDSLRSIGESSKGGNGSGAAHHREPASSSRKGLASLRRRRTPVVAAPPRILESMTSQETRTPFSEDEPESEQLDFLGDDELGKELGALSSHAVEAELETQPAIDEVVGEVSQSVEIPQEEVSAPDFTSDVAAETPEIEPEAELAVEEDVAPVIPDPVTPAAMESVAPEPVVPPLSVQDFSALPVSLISQEPVAAEMPAPVVEPAPVARPKAKVPINLQRSVEAASAPEPPAVGESDEIEDESVTEIVSTGAVADEPTEPAPVAAEEATQAVATPEPELPSWAWLKPKLNEPAPIVEEPASEMPVPSESQDKVSPPELDGSDLLVDEDEVFAGGSFGSGDFSSHSHAISPLIDPDTDLHDVLPKSEPKGQEPLAEMPPAPGPFPKWNLLGPEANFRIKPAGSDVKEPVAPAPSIPEPVGEAAPVAPSVEEEEVEAILPAKKLTPPEAPEATAAAEPETPAKPLMSGPVWMSPTEGNTGAKSSPWMSPGQQAAAAAASSEDLIETDADVPSFQSPRFLGSEGNRVTPWKPPIPEGFAPSAAPSAPVADPVETEVPAPEPVALAPTTESDESAPPPLFDLSSFGEGEPPRPGERVVAPPQKITLPAFVSEGSEAKATVSKVVEAAKVTPPLAEEAAKEVEEKAPVAEVVEPVAAPVAPPVVPEPVESEAEVAVPVSGISMDR
ncbi:MAG: hypothetical protein KDM63_05945, partial [Verrucomicrobiae bacterium]|nr:hypothetical protein [Verrucomicrobiae bacterium]